MRRVAAVDVRMMEASGIGTYIRNLLPLVIAAREDMHFHLLCRPGEPEGRGWSGMDRVSFIPCRAPIYSPAEQLELPARIPRGTRLFWSPHYNFPLLYRGRLLVTVHDLFHLAMLTWARDAHNKVYARFMMSSVRRRATAILCNSRFTAAELERLSGPARGKVSVTPLGVSPFWRREVAGGRLHDRPYLLFVGNVKPHKNLGGLLSAFASIMDRVPHDLVVAGRTTGFVTGDSRALAAARGLGRVRLAGEVGEEDLRRWYTHADALVFPSFYEGFGLPPLEAMACGCPVISSCASSLPEVCGDAALYTDPRDPRDMAAKILLLLEDAALRERLASKGLARAGQFSWDECARRTLAVFATVADA